MEAARARQIRDWIIFSRVNLPSEDAPYDMDNYTRRKNTLDALLQKRVPSPTNDLLFDSQEYVTSTNSFLSEIWKIQRQYLIRHYKRHNKKLYYLSILSNVLLISSFLIPFVLGFYFSLTSLPLGLKMLYCAISAIVVWGGGLLIVRVIEGRIFWAKERSKENDEFDRRWAALEMAFIEQSYPAKWATSRYARHETYFYAVFGVRGRDVPSYDGKSYQWRHVGKGKFIIVDKKTKKEPELLPGVSPYYN